MAGLVVDPTTAQFPTAEGGKTTHAVTNATEGRVAIKVKCSDNSLYRIKPVYDFIEPGQTVQLEVTRLPGPAKEDIVVVLMAPVAPEEVTPQNAFPTGGTFPETTLQVTGVDQ